MRKIILEQKCEDATCKSVIPIEHVRTLHTRARFEANMKLFHARVQFHDESLTTLIMRENVDVLRQSLISVETRRRASSVLLFAEWAGWGQGGGEGWRGKSGGGLLLGRA